MWLCVMGRPFYTHTIPDNILAQLYCGESRPHFNGCGEHNHLVVLYIDTVTKNRYSLLVGLFAVLSATFRPSHTDAGEAAVTCLAGVCPAQCACITE